MFLSEFAKTDLYSILFPANLCRDTNEVVSHNSETTNATGAQTQSPDEIQVNKVLPGDSKVQKVLRLTCLVLSAD